MCHIFLVTAITTFLSGLDQCAYPLSTLSNPYPSSQMTCLGPCSCFLFSSGPIRQFTCRQHTTGGRESLSLVFFNKVTMIGLCLVEIVIHHEIVSHMLEPNFWYHCRQPASVRKGSSSTGTPNSPFPFRQILLVAAYISPT